jgi:hypothetical protein
MSIVHSPTLTNFVSYFSFTRLPHTFFFFFFFDDADLYLGGGHEEIGGDEFLCPFCAEDYDVVGLCCHINEEHPVEAKNGVSIFSFFFLFFLFSLE